MINPLSVAHIGVGFGPLHEAHLGFVVVELVLGDAIARLVVLSATSSLAVNTVRGRVTYTACESRVTQCAASHVLHVHACDEPLRITP